MQTRIQCQRRDELYKCKSQSEMREVMQLPCGTVGCPRLGAGRQLRVAGDIGWRL